jgi:hypothetical protein
LEFALEQKKKKEADFDKIANIEEEKQWKKISDLWELEEKARIDLLRSVYKEREEALMLKSKFYFLSFMFIFFT